MEFEGFLDPHSLQFSFESSRYLGEDIWQNAKEGDLKAMLMLCSVINALSSSDVLEEISERVKAEVYIFSKGRGEALLKSPQKAKTELDYPGLGKGKLEFYVDNLESLLYGTEPSVNVNLSLLSVDSFIDEKGEEWGWKREERYIFENPIFALAEVLREESIVGGVSIGGRVYMNPNLLFNLELYKRASELEDLDEITRHRIRQRIKVVEMYMHSMEFLSILNERDPKEGWKRYVEDTLLNTSNVILGESMKEVLDSMKEGSDYIIHEGVPITDIPSLLPFIKDEIYRLYPTEKSISISNELGEKILTMEKYTGQWEPGDIFVRVNKSMDITVDFSHTPEFNVPFVCTKVYSFIKSKKIVLGELG